MTKAGGAFGIFTAIIAWYGSAAVVINSTWGRTMLPVGVFVQPKKKVVRLGRQACLFLHASTWLILDCSDRRSRMRRT